MIPDFPNLRRLVLSDSQLLAEALTRVGAATCDLNPANLFIWRDSEATSITRIGDSLCILVEPCAQPAYFLEPIGGNRIVEAVRACLTRVDRISRAGRKLVDHLSPTEFEFQELRDYFDYVYRTQTLVELKGKKFDGKRNHIHKFSQTYPDYDFRPLERSLFGGAMALFDKWAERQQNIPVPANFSASLKPECQRKALERAFEGFDQLGLLGGAMMVRGDVQGFIVASTDPAGNAFVHFQYANAEILGIYQTLLWEACRRLFTGCAWINLEEDLGLPGLRKTKLSYHPLRLEQKFEIRRLEAAAQTAPAVSRSLVSTASAVSAAGRA